MKKINKQLLLLHIAVMLLGLSGTLGQFVQVSALMITLGRVVCSFSVLGIYLLIKKKSFQLKSLFDVKMIILGGIVLAIHWCTFFQSIQSSSVAIGIIAFSTFPFFLTFLEPLIYHEKLSILNILSSFVLLLGIIITIPSFSLESQVTLGILWGMVSSVTYAFLSLINRYLSSRYEGEKICFYEQGVVALLLFPSYFLIDTTWTTNDIIGIIIIGVLCTAVAYCLYVSSQKSIKAQTVGLISGLETVYGISYAFILLHEIPSGREILGACIILGVAIFTSLQIKEP